MDEAVALLVKYDMHASGGRSYHFQIADASGKTVVVEYIGDEMNVLDPGDPTTARVPAEGKTNMAATNFLLTHVEYDFGGGEDRYATVIGAHEAADGVMDASQAMDPLQSVSRAGTIKDNGEGFQTQWAVVYNLERGTAKICMGGKYDEVHELSIA